LYIGALEKVTVHLSGITGILGDRKKEYYRVDAEEKYGLGHVHDKAQYCQTFGIVHPETRTVEGRPCNFASETMHRQFSPHLREDGMGIDYSQIDFKFKDTP
jgi:hypothetical protein